MLDEQELFQQLQAQEKEVKEEIPDADFQEGGPSSAPPPGGGAPEDPEDEEAPMPTGLAEMEAEMAAEEKKAVEEAKRFNEIVLQEPPQKKKRTAPATSRSSGRSGSEKRDDTPKAPLTTFGHSSRPRRSVNYASIERGDEAQAQSLVKEFTSGKKKPKKTRDEMDENYVEGSDVDTNGRKRKGGAPSTSGYHNPTSTLYTARNLLIEKTPLEEYAEVVPRPTDPRPIHGNFSTSLEKESGVRRASGGFRKYIAWLTDDQVTKLLQIVAERCIIGGKHSVIQTIRHVYNSMPLAYRMEWERSARMDVFDSRQFVTDLAMPLSEIQLKDPKERPIKKEVNQVQANCCSMRPLFSDMFDTIAHYLKHHDVVHLFGCDFCFKAFSSRYDLTKHDCKDFAAHMYQLILRQETLTLEVAYMYLCCAQCGLWLSVKPGAKGWSYFATAIKNHTCQSLAPVIMYFIKPLKNEGKGSRVTFQIISTLDIGLPTFCSECETEDFRSVAEAEEHYKTVHKKSYKCSKCSMSFGTQFLYKHHCETHQAASTQIAQWLLYSATFHPPPNSGRRPHVGFATEIPAIGGLVAGELDTYTHLEKKTKEFVKPLENTLRKKIFRWKKVKKGSKGTTAYQREDGDSSGEEEFQRRLREDEEDEESSSAASSDSGMDSVTTNRRKKPKPEIKVRGDLGYEHIDREEMFARSEEEKEARKMLDTLLNRNVFMTRERLLEPEEALEILKESKKAQLPPQQCSLADDIAAKTMRQITIPLWNCIDPLKEALLVNKICIYCPKCVAIFNNDIKSHAQECQVDEDTLTEVFHCALGPHAGVRCIEEDCPTRLCSIPALRVHMLDVHNQKIKIPKPSEEKPINGQDLKYDSSIMAMAKFFAQFQLDERSDLARMTDSECHMPVGGVLEPKPNQKIKYLVQKEMPILTPPGPPQLFRQHPHQTRIKPYRMPRNTRWYTCSGCTQQYGELENFLDHLTREHLHPCTSCGKSFNSLNKKRIHVCSMEFADARAPGTIVNGYCPSCKVLGTVDFIAKHMFTYHFSTIEYISETGEILPKIRDLRVRPIPPPAERAPQRVPPNPIVDWNHSRDAASTSTARLHTIRPGAVQVLGSDLKTLCLKEPPPNSFDYFPPDPRNVNTRLMCYLCELTFGSVGELGAHLDEHPEKWARCPFCERTVSDHYDLQKHIMTEHVVRISGAICCAFCHESHRFMASHLLFRCQKISKCSICGQKSNNEALNRSHINRFHAQSLRRFQCAYCPRFFISVGEYYEHKCHGLSTRFYWCSCNDKRFFTSPNDFCDHYDTTHVFGGNGCKLDGFRAKTSMEELIQHRNQHLKSGFAKDARRQIYILCRMLAPKQNSSYVRHITHQGPPPSSYQNVDRSGEFHLMSGAGAGSTGSPPRTLFEALEGVNAISKLPNGATQRNVTLQPRSTAHSVQAQAQPVAEAPSTSSDCIILSDGEPEQAGTSAQSAPQVDREVSVRVEATQDGYKAASTRPGYVVDSDEPEVDGSQPNTEPVVKEIVDENGDDELAVVAEVEHTSGTLPSTIAASTGREKKFKCTKCSSAFITEKSLRFHVATDHKMDAGDTICSETYGIPTNLRQGWLCRNCSVVFEDQIKHHRHMGIHGDTTHTCALCCGISFNQSASNNHGRGHMDKKVFFACGTCQIKFPTDLHLMEHLTSSKHNQKLFYFCKVCAFGTTDADLLYNHILIHAGHPYTIAQRFGAVPVQLLNYDPKDENEFKVKVLQKQIQLHVPSDCSHRSMLAQTDTLVSCKTCHCYQPYYNYMACNKYTEETGFPPFPTMEVALEAFPLVNHLSGQAAQTMVRYGHTKGAVPMLPPPTSHRGDHQLTPQQQANQHRFPNMLPPQYQMDPRRVQHQNPQMMNGGQNGRPPIQMTPNGPRVNFQGMNGGPPPPRRSPPDAAAVRRFVVTSNGKPIGVVPQQQQQQAPPTLQNYGAPPPLPPVVAAALGAAASSSGGGQIIQRNHVAVQTKCKFTDCNKTIFSDFDRDLHLMHQSTNTWFCRQCGESKRSERDLFSHYVKDHLTPAFQKQQTAGFKPYVINLKCPFPTCPHNQPQNAFQTPKVFEKHMRTVHAKELPHEANCCDARFVTDDLRAAHEALHRLRGGAGGELELDNACCSICGSLNMWTMPKDTKTGCLQSHTIRHGLDYRSSCRQCLKQFPADVNQALAAEHIRDEHGRRLDSGILCQLCGEMGMDDAAFGVHCRQKHIFNILVKSAQSARGELVVSTGEEYENFTGLRITRNMRAARVASSASAAQQLQQQQQPSTSSAGSAALLPPINRQVPSTSGGGNAALLNIANAIQGIGAAAGPSAAARRAPGGPPTEIFTIDSDSD